MIELLLPYGFDTMEYSWLKGTIGIFMLAYYSVAKKCQRGALLAHVCCVVRFIPLQGCLLIQISMTSSDMGDGLFATPKHSNSTFIMLYLVHEMDIDYLVVDEMVNIQDCLITLACLE
jgi:hypothetical protein